ncbi:heme exporter protein CcmB [Roseateles sp. BYS87W]|uniref:Heme exporter protein B n=1 Tax=Pelomonas baiyunensis TaxID=3299026 RepID=A0ABW7H1W4_9BURK
MTDTPAPPAAPPVSGVLRATRAVWRRDWRTAQRRKGEALLPLGFFLVSGALQPLGLNPDPGLMRQVAPGLIWSAALLAALLPLPGLFAQDQSDGSLDQMCLGAAPLWLLGLVKVAGHWCWAGAPLVLAAPLLGVLYGLDGDALLSLLASLLLGTPVLSLLGAVGAALTVGLRQAAALILLIVLPLAVPVLVFGTSAVQATMAGQSPWAPLGLIAAQLLVMAWLAPFLIAKALRLACE